MSFDSSSVLGFDNDSLDAVLSVMAAASNRGDAERRLTAAVKVRRYTRDAESVSVVRAGDLVELFPTLSGEVSVIPVSHMELGSVSAIRVVTNVLVDNGKVGILHKGGSGFLLNDYEDVVLIINAGDAFAK